MVTVSAEFILIERISCNWLATDDCWGIIGHFQIKEKSVHRSRSKKKKAPGIPDNVELKKAGGDNIDAGGDNIEGEDSQTRLWSKQTIIIEAQSLTTMCYLCIT